MSLNYIKLLFTKNKLLFILLLTLIFRLLFHIDNYLSIRDFDFFPGKYLSLNIYQLSRPFCQYINYFTSKLLSLNIMQTKNLLGFIQTIIFIITASIFVNRINSNYRVKTNFLCLLFANPVIFVLHDTLSPYFWLIILSMLQFILIQNYLKNYKGLDLFLLISILAIFFHWLSIINLICGLYLVYKYKKVKTIKTNSILIIICSIIIAGLFLFLAAKWIFITELLFKYQNNQILLNKPYPNLQTFILAILANLSSVLPFLLGLYNLNNIITIILGLFLIYHFYQYFKLNKKISTPEQYIKIIIGLIFIFSLILQIINKIILNSLHPTALLYTIVGLPFYLYFLANYLQSLPYKKHLLIISLIILINIISGYRFRQQSFDLINYNQSLFYLPKNIQHYLLPSFIDKSMYLKFYKQSINSPEKFYKIDNFKNIMDRSYILDLVTYKELDSPLYDYNNYENNLKVFWQDNKIKYKEYIYPTFKRFFVNNK